MAQAVYDDQKPTSDDNDHQIKTSTSSTKNGSSSGLNAEQLNSAEESSTSANASTTDTESSHIANQGGFWRSTTSSTQKSKGRLQSMVSSGLKGKRKFIIGGSVAGLIVLLVIFLVIFLSTLLVPGLAQNILTYEFARVERQFNQDNDEVISESAAVDSVEDEATQTAVSNEFSNLNDGLFTKIKNLTNTNNLFNNLQDEGAIKFNYAKDSNGLGYLDSMTIGNQTISIDPSTQTFTGKVFHPIQNFKYNVQFADDVSSALQEVMPNDGVGIIVRGRIEQLIMNAIDAPRFAWTVSKFKGDTSEQADQEQQVEAEEAINPNPTSDVAGSIVTPEQDAITQGAQDEQATLSQSTDDGVPSTVPPLLSGLTDSLFTSGVTQALKALNPAYAIFLPLCIIYDGSINNTGDAQQTINVNSDEDQRSFFYLESAADQQKDGNTNGEAVGALNNKLGNDVGSSIPMERANGQSVNTSNVTVSPQTAGNGEYTAINAFAPSLAPLINPLASTICPAITNVYFAGGLTLGVIASWFFGDEGAEAAADASTTAADNLFQDATGKALSILDNIGVTEKAAPRGVALVTKLQEILPDKKELVKIAGISGLDVVVRLATAMKMGELNDGLSQGNDFANQADAGGNLNANQDMQQQFYGVPLSQQQTAYNDEQDSNFIADEYKSESLYSRYVSPTNPDSLVAKVGLDIYGDMNKSFVPDFVNSIAKIFNPTTLFSSLYNLLSPNAKVLADTVTPNDQSDYGIVQWGYTDQEESLINSITDNTYQPLENDEILSKYPTQVSYIQQTYGPCFTDSMAQLLTTMPSQGPDTSDYYITRDQNGNVVGGLCTEQYLGPNSSDSQAYDSSDSMNDLVFRWRLQQAYDNTADTLTSIANPTQSSSTSATNNFNAQAAQQVAQQDSTNGTNVGFAVFDSSGNPVASYNDTFENYGASITKAMLLVAYLNQTGSATLSTQAQSELTNMIENSDDPSANWVYSQLTNGPNEINTVATQAGMTGFKFDNSDPLYVLGQSQITAADFARFFANIGNNINSSQRVFGMKLLSNLSSTDQVGLLKSGLPGIVYSKEGWKPEPDNTNPFGQEGAPYIVNQAAQFSENGTTYGIAVTVGGTTNQSSGEAIVQNVVSALVGSGQ